MSDSNETMAQKAGLVLLGILMIFISYYAPIGLGFQLLIGVIGAVFVVIGVLKLASAL